MVVVLFRRDLRLIDNTALIAASKSYQKEKIIPIFHLNDEQVTEENSFISFNSVRFMIESLFSLQQELLNKGSDLLIIYGNLQYLVKVLNEIGEPIFANSDYTPFAKERDNFLKENLENITFCPDYMLFEGIVSKQGTVYKVFKNYYTEVIKRIKNVEVDNKKINNFIIKKELDKIIKSNKIKTQNLTEFNNYIMKFEEFLCPYPAMIGGREEGEKRLDNLVNLKDYKKTRDYPSLETSLLSAHIKFGTLSIRECAKKLRDLKNEDLLRQIIWHDFYLQLMDGTPNEQSLLGNKDGSGNIRNRKFKWTNDKKIFELWQTGNLGIPWIDAGMRQLLLTGYMHNRVRMAVSNFLVFILRINWKWGEKHFAQNLIDYDPSSNIFNWMTNVGIGTDNASFLRIFNPYKQAKDYDNDCEYIKTFIPELENVSPKDILKWDTEPNVKCNYPFSKIDYKNQYKTAKNWFYSN